MAPTDGKQDVTPIPVGERPTIGRMGVTSEVKGGFSALKSHWIFFLVAIVVLVGMAMKYDRKNNGAISSRLASLPLFGRFFA